MKNYKLQPYHIKILSIPDYGSLFLHTPSLQIYPLTDNSLENFLSYYSAHGYIDTKKHFGYEYFKKAYHFICNTISKAPISISPIPPDKTVEDVNVVVFPIAADCNLMCPYCFAQTEVGFNFPNYTKEDLEEIVSFVIKKHPNVETPIVVVFFGGEPLLKLKIIRDTIEIFKSRYSNHKIGYSITTNGTIINDEILSMLKENNFSVLVSIDGYDNPFNLRKFRNGRKSIDVVLRNINKLVEVGIKPELRATLLNTNPYIKQTYEFFEELHLPFHIVFAYSSENKTHSFASYTKENIDNIKIQLDEVLDYYIAKIERKETLYNRFFADFLPSFHYRIKRHYPCSAGVTYYTITADGNIYSCAHLMNNPEYRIGNILTGMHDKSPYIPVDVDEIEGCRTCWAKYLCSGGCLTQKIAEGRSNMEEKNPQECELEKTLWEFYLKIYYMISKVAPKYLEVQCDNVPETNC